MNGSALRRSGGAVLLAVLAGCAGVQPARMQPPEALPADAQLLVLDGIGGGTTGRVAVDGVEGRFTRSASRLGLLDGRIERDRVGLQLDWPAAGAGGASCQGRQVTVSGGILAAAVRRFSWGCDWAGTAPARLAVSAPDATVGPGQARQGRYEAGGLVLDIRSEHRLQGTPLPLASPAGYVFTHQGRVVGALDLAGGRPRLWRPLQPGDLQQAVTRWRW
jgi:hypothetical protein